MKLKRGRWSWDGGDGREDEGRSGPEGGEDGTEMELREGRMGQGWS